MSNYNTRLQSNNADLQQVLQSLQEKAAGGEQATPEISVDTNGLITAIAGAKSSTYQMAFQPAKTITPSTVSQIAVSCGYYTGGDITVAAVLTQAKSVSPSSATQNVTPDSGKFLSKVTVDPIPSEYVVPSGTLTITMNGTHDVKNYASATVEVAGSGSSEVVEYSEAEDAIISRGISGTYMNDRVQTVGNCAFAYCSSLTSVSFLTCTTISNSAFYYCTSLTSVSFPACTYIGSSAFCRCSKLTSANFPVCTDIGIYAFYECSKLTSANFPVCATISGYAFNCCSSLTSVSFPDCTDIGTYAFCRCSKLTSANFPVCATISGYAFNGCSSLTSVSFPACTYIGSSAFCRCSKLTSANFPVCVTIGGYAFSGCHNLSSLTLGASTVCTLANSNAFSSTTYAGYSNYFSGTPYIYVPASLVSAYQSATNWTYFSSYFSSIESLE